MVSQFGRAPGVSRGDAVVADELVGAAATAEGAEGAVDPSAGHRARRSDRALFRAPQSRRRLVLVLVGVVLMRSRVRHEGLHHVRRDLHHLAQLADLPLKPGDLAADPDERLVVREDVLPLLGLGEIAQRRELVAQMPHAPLGGVAVELRGETVEVEILRVILGPRVERLAQLGHRGRGHRGRLCGHRCQLSNIPFCSSVTRLGSVSGFSAPLQSMLFARSCIIRGAVDESLVPLARESRQRMMFSVYSKQ